MPKINTAMVFAAGLGKRMRPLTDTTPKPLIEVGGKSMLSRCLDGLSKMKVKNVVINVHHLSDQVEALVDKRNAVGEKLRVTLSLERDVLLETGGGIVKALPLLGEQPMYTINSDIIWEDGAEPALKRLADMWDEGKMDALLLLQPVETAIGYEGEGNFALTDDGGLVKTEGGNLPYVYTGVQIVKPSLFNGMKEEPFSLNVIYKNALQPDGKLNRIYGLVHDGRWFHVGTPESVETVGKMLISSQS